MQAPGVIQHRERLAFQHKRSVKTSLDVCACALNSRGVRRGGLTVCAEPRLVFHFVFEILEDLHLTFSVGVFSQFPVNSREPKMGILRELGIFLQSQEAIPIRFGSHIRYTRTRSSVSVTVSFGCRTMSSFLRTFPVEIRLTRPAQIW